MCTEKEEVPIDEIMDDSMMKIVAMMKEFRQKQITCVSDLSQKSQKQLKQIWSKKLKMLEGNFNSVVEDMESGLAHFKWIEEENKSDVLNIRALESENEYLKKKLKVIGLSKKAKCSKLKRDKRKMRKQNGILHEIDAISKMIEKKQEASLQEIKSLNFRLEDENQSLKIKLQRTIENSLEMNEATNTVETKLMGEIKRETL